MTRFRMDDLYRYGWRSYIKKDLDKSISELRYLYEEDGDVILEEDDNLIWIRNKKSHELRRNASSKRL